MEYDNMLPVDIDHERVKTRVSSRMERLHSRPRNKPTRKKTRFFNETTDPEREKIDQLLESSQYNIKQMVEKQVEDKLNKAEHQLMKNIQDQNEHESNTIPILEHIKNKIEEEDDLSNNNKKHNINDDEKILNTVKHLLNEKIKEDDEYVKENDDEDFGPSRFDTEDDANEGKKRKRSKRKAKRHSKRKSKVHKRSPHRSKKHSTRW